MDKKILVASAFAAGAAAIFYWVKRNRKVVSQVSGDLTKPSRHLTNAFVKAKQNVISNVSERL